MKSPTILSALFRLATFAAAISLAAGSLGGCAMAIGTVATGVVYGVTAVVAVPLSAVVDSVDDGQDAAPVEAVHISSPGSGGWNQCGGANPPLDCYASDDGAAKVRDLCEQGVTSYCS